MERVYENLYHMLMSAIPSSVLLIDQGFRVQSANRNFIEKALRSERATIGQPLDEVFPQRILTDMDLKERIRKVFKTNEPLLGERMTYRAPGIPLRIYYYSIIPVPREERIESVMLLMEDVTEQIRLSEEVRQAERHLASVVESANDLVVSTDAEGRVISWNRAAEKLTGYPPKEVQGHFFFEFFAEVHRDHVRNIFGTEGSPDSPAPDEWNLITRDHQDVPVSWIRSTMKNDFGGIEGFVVIGRDLTERRRLEAQILRSQKLAALGVMAGGIAHEIRNPLAVASSAAQFLLEEDVTRDLARECAGKIHKGIQRASIIIENLLRFARPSVSMEMEFVDLILVVRETLPLIANEARLRKVEVVFHPIDAPLVVSGLPNLLQQLFMNLFLNAFKAMPKGGLLSIMIVREGDQAVLRIRDTGCGIPQNTLDRIFDPFYTTSRPGEGVGLGLSLCYSIVKQHFGSIEVESQEGAGTTFTLRLPLS